MMSSKKLKRRSFIFGLLVFIILFFPVSVTEVRCPERSLFFNENEFSLMWVHSVEKEEWQEFYRRNSGSLLLTYTKFKTFGAGVPSEGKITEQEKGYVIYQVDRKIEEINLVVSKNVHSTLFIGNKEIPLFSMVKEYEEVTIKPAFRPLWTLWIT